jgi:hypothetical protein
MRLLAIALLAATACGPGSLYGRAGQDEERDLRAHPNVDAARELDQQGVHCFREGRYGDAIRYFRAAYRMGGPSSELWNIARSHERLDDAEAAARAIDEYLAQRDLSPPDRAEAEREGRALRERSSMVTVTTTPAGAAVTLDGKPTAEPTPVSIEVRPGPHTISVRRDGYATEVRPLEARFGRAVIVSLDLGRADR